MDKTMAEVESSIHTRCAHGDLDSVMTLVDNGTDVNIRDDDERTPLHWAASSNNSLLVEYLLSSPSICVNAQDDSGYTPLMCAVAAGREENAVLLLNAGADVNLQNENKETVLHMTRNNTNLLRLVIDKITDINKQNEYGLTALMKVCSLGCLESISLLLEHHADLTIKDVSGNTAAHYAAFDKRREAYLLLKRHGYDEDTVNNEHKTALDYV